MWFVFTFFAFGGIGNDAVRLNRRGDKDASTDYRAIADDGISAKDCCTGVYDNVITDRGVAFSAISPPAPSVCVNAFCTEGDPLIHSDTIADGGGFANDNARAVVDKKALPDFGTRMYIDAGFTVCMLGHQAGQKRHAKQIKDVCDAIDGGGEKAGVTEQNLGFGGRSRVAVECGDKVKSKHTDNGIKPCEEAVCGCGDIDVGAHQPCGGCENPHKVWQDVKVRVMTGHEGWNVR